MFIDFFSELRSSGRFITPTIAADIAALLLLINVTIYTATYRKRGKPEDKLFFSMAILDIVFAVADAINSLFGKLNMDNPKYSAVIIAGHTVTTVTCIVLCFLFVAYLHAAYAQKHISKPLFALLLLPLFLMVILSAINPFTGQLFYVDPSTGAYIHGKFWMAIGITAYFYAALHIWMLQKINRKYFMFVLFLLILRTALFFFLYEISATPVFLAILLVFLHVCLMNKAFYEVEQ